jgi:hypothetical protein
MKKHSLIIRYQNKSFKNTNDWFYTQILKMLHFRLCILKTHAYQKLREMKKYFIKILLFNSPLLSIFFMKKLYYYFFKNVFI